MTAYLYAHKTIEDCTGAEDAGVELASKVVRISYTRKSRMGNATSALVDKDFASIMSNKTRQ